MIKLVPLLISFCLFCRFLPLIAIDKKKQFSLCSEAFFSRDPWSEQHIFRRRYASAFHFVVSSSEALYSAHSPVNVPRLSFSCSTGRRNHTSNLYLANLCRIFLREGIRKSRASGLEVNNNPSVPLTLSLINQ